MMNLAYLIPERGYDFLRQLVGPLSDRGVKVWVDHVPAYADLVLAAMLPASPQWGTSILSSSKPYVLWHWDDYSFVDHGERRWRQFWEMLPGAADIWSCSYEVARSLKERHGLDSYMMPAWVVADHLEPVRPEDQGDYVLYASSSASLGKRTDWADKACTLLGYRLEMTVGQALSRPAYLSLVRRCRLYLCTAFEESNGTIPAMEAAAAGRPVVITDLAANREVFGSSTPGVYYFPPLDFRALLDVLRAAWNASWATEAQDLRQRILTHFDLPAVADRIHQRLRYVSGFSARV